jgi:hypothetical protein
VLPLIFSPRQGDPGTFGDHRASHASSRMVPTISTKTITYNLKMATPGQANAVMVEEIDQSLLQIAAFDQRSSPAVQSLASSWKHPDGIELLVNLYQRLQAREAKWLTRLILKSYAPIKFPENLEPGPQHSFLPTCVQLKIQFPSSAPLPVRRDGTRIIVGVGANETVYRHPAPPRAAPQSSFPASTPIAATIQALPTPVASSRPAYLTPAPSISLPPHTISTPFSPVPAPPATSSALQPTSSTSTWSLSASRRALSTPTSSMQVPTPTVGHSRCSPSTSTVFSHPAARSSPNNQPTPPSRTILGQMSQNIPTSSPQKSPMRSSPVPSIFTSTSGTCKWTPNTCPLSTCIFILGPCISKIPYITEELLSWHASRYTSSVRALAHPALQRRCSRTGKRFRKIALVESHRTQPTVDFLRRISSLRLTRGGKKEWVVVYDWRLLECITKTEQGKELTYNPWVRCWICDI